MDWLKRRTNKKQEEPEPQPKPELELSQPPQIEPEPKAEVKEFMDIGGSPVPGLTLRHVLRGHTGLINRIAWSPNGSYLASPSKDETIRIWNVECGECIAVLKGHESSVLSVAWSPDGHRLTSGSGDGTIRIWDAEIWETLAVLKVQGSDLRSITWSPDGGILASTAGSTVQIRSTNDWKLITTFKHTDTVRCLAWQPNRQILASSGCDKVIRIWELDTGEEIRRLEGHSAWVDVVAWSPDGQLIVSGADPADPSIRVWSVKTGKQLSILEGHTNGLFGLSFSADGRLLASKSWDETVRLWRTDIWSETARIRETGGVTELEISLAFHPCLPVLATLGEKDTIIRIWELDEALLLSASASLSTSQQSVHYTTAKLVIVGDSGVGKTGLGWRLAHGEFKEHASTHGQQFWAIPQLGLKRADGTECEAVLWDLAGQHVYRQIHSIFLENVAAALVLFDPSNRQDPLKGAQFWLEQLKGKGQLPPAVLVGARVDRGAPALSQQELDQFCQRYGIRGGYISTSALSGEGLDALLETVKAQIPWDEMTATVTTVTFKRIKDYVLALKEKPDRKGVLVSPAELRAQLETFEVSETSKVWEFTDAEMMTAVGHLETHGYVTILKSSDGETYILLTPELLVGLASSIVLRADKNPRELGAVSETELLQGKYQFDELKGLDKTEQQILLDAAVLRFLEHSICFRETLGSDTLLIFPGLIKQKRPLKDDIPSTDDISYIVRGRVENLYPMLVVLLGYTPSFTRINQWQNQAQYEMGEGEICGFRLIEEREGEIELVLYYGDKMPPSGRAKFQELFEQFLYQRDVEVTRFPPVVCPKGHRQERATVIKRVREGKTFAFCDECGSKVELPKIDEPSFGIRASSWLQREEATARLRNTYEVNLARVKSYRRAWATPRCYVSRVPEQAKWAERFVHDLNDAGVFVVEKASQVQPDDWVIVLDAPAYQKAWQASKEDARLVQARFNKRNLISIVVEGNPCLPHEIIGCKPGDFCNETHYPVSLFDLVLNLYAIPRNHAGFAPLRQSLHQQWEQNLAKMPTRGLEESDFEQEEENMGNAGTQNKKRFDVALSFPGEYRKQVAAIAEKLAQVLGKEQVFYDKYYEAELARPDLDTYIQAIYHDQSELIVVFLCAEYERKEWCGLEWRAVRDLLKKKQTAAIMPMRFDDTHIPGLFSLDGYIDIANRNADEVAKLILQRLELNRKP